MLGGTSTASSDWDWQLAERAREGGSLRRDIDVKNRNLTTLIALTASVMGAAGVAQENLPAARREALLELARAQPPDGLKTLVAALNDDNPVLRRTAVRGLLAYGAASHEHLRQALNHADNEVALAAFQGLRLAGALTNEAFELALKPERQLALRLLAVQELAARNSVDETTRRLLELANRDSSETVRTIAAQRLHPFPFQREVRSIRWNADQILNVVSATDLPLTGWRLKFDPQHAGHALGWFKPDWNDVGWQAVDIGFWDQYGHAGPQDIGWYRNRFELPTKQEHQTVELVFEMVAGSAWVWLNGEYAGQRLAGIEGWNTPFTIDVTPMARWGETNQITVRVHSLGRIGGLAKPIKLEALKLGGQ